MEELSNGVLTRVDSLNFEFPLSLHHGDQSEGSRFFSTELKLQG